MAIKGIANSDLIVDPGLKNFFDNSMDFKQRRAVFMSAYRKAAKPLVQETKQNLKSRRKSKAAGSNLNKSIGVKAKSKQVMLLVGARTYGNFKGFHGHLLNYGTQERFRKTKSRKRVSTGKMPAMNFWTDALESKTELVGNSIQGEIENALRKWTERKGISV